ncbi:protein tyrosine phosphatase [Limimaricola cinnabarinus]|jgi:protein tyrosine/serine phosphatase|uniref:Protein tyrosine phosphatase n=2 Tax=Limimaricola cinnabarinus TaxID=1125964 RepID=A0A2G1ML35_9RHOB|nr:protein tyrosine phosphatase [Limimaricola cinnabarinus]
MGWAMKLLDGLRAWERRARMRHHDIADAGSRRRALASYLILDHAILRYWWTNFHLVSPGVFRSNQPTHGRFGKMAKIGIRTVINLRGEGPHPRYLFEAESCRALGLRLVSTQLSARRAAPPEQILRLFALLREAERPVVMHCKSGADRAGFASALHLLAEGHPIEEARRQLHPRFLHFRRSRTGVLDHILDLYEARQAQGPIGIEEWIATEYDAEAAQQGFEAGRTKA